MDLAYESVYRGKASVDQGIDWHGKLEPGKSEE